MKLHKLVIPLLISAFFIVVSCDKADKADKIFWTEAGSLMYTAWKGQVDFYYDGKFDNTEDVSFQFDSEKTGISKSVYPGGDPYVTAFDYEFDGKRFLYMNGNSHLRGSWFLVSSQKDQLIFHSNMYEDEGSRDVMKLSRIY